jgi:hypothetical protein
MLALGCGAPEEQSSGVTASNHPFFPISGGDMHEVGLTRLAEDGPFTCESCHPATLQTFEAFTCLGCHGHTPTVANTIHSAVGPNDAGVAFALESGACLSCHPAADKMPFHHTNITDSCAKCHDEGRGFAALPVKGLTHPPMNSADCSACHSGFGDWKIRGAVVQ